MRPTDVVWIGGAGHSGSTLLGLMLGAHEDFFYAGEAKKAIYLGDPSKPVRKRQCKLCGPACPVWGDMAPETMDRLYGRLSARTGAAVIVDSSKDEEWLRKRMSEVEQEGGTGAFIFLTRDGRAVVNSRLRKYPQRSVADTIDAWRAKIETMDVLFDEYAGPKRMVRYENLVADPLFWLNQITALVGQKAHAAMLRFQEFEHHPLGGNNGTQSQLRDRSVEVVVSDRHRGYYSSAAGVVHDLRWRDEMNEAALALFEERAGEFNRRFAFEGDAPLSKRADEPKSTKLKETDDT